MSNSTSKYALISKLAGLLSTLMFFTAQTHGQTYCTATNTSSSSYYINGVNTTGGATNISNSSTGFTATGYANYTATQIVSVYQGNSFTLNCAAPFSDTYVWAVYIDWNNDGDFADPGETVYTASSYVNTISTVINVPLATPAGNLRMRIRDAYISPVPPACGSNTWGEAEDYTITVVALPSCSTVTFPSSATASVTPSAVCVSGNTTISMTPSTAIPTASGITYKWQSGPTATGTFTDIPGAITTTPSFTTTTATTTNTYFRCVVLCNAGTAVLTSSASLLTVNNPGSVTTTGASRCGPGSVTLSGVPSISSNTVGWYAAPTGGLALATGSTYTTPYLPATTTFYADAEAVQSPYVGTVGTGTLTNTTSGSSAYPSPYGNYYGSDHEQYLMTAAELYAVGISPGNFTSIAFDLASAYTYAPLSSFQIRLANTAVANLSTGAFISTGFTTVIPAATYTPPNAAGFATIPFTTPFTWDGVSNVLVDVSFSNCSVCNGTSSCTTSYTSSGQVHQTATTGNKAHFIYYDNNCTITSFAPSGSFIENAVAQRPNMRFGTIPVCASPRQAVVATINASPAISIANPATICSNKVGTIAATSSPVSNYSTYSWAANVTDLYSNAAATTPYTTGSSPTVYLKSTVSGPHTLYLFSSGATPAACTHADTISVWVQPDSIKIIGAPDSICVTGTSTLTLSPATGYAPNSIQWQESANGTTYANVTGATAAVYTTPTLTTEHYYRALIKSTNDTCEMPIKHIAVVNPQLIGASDSFTCGPGTVTLKAQTGGSSTAKWYDVPTYGNPVATGNIFTTPYLSTSQTYYVDAEGGASVPNIIQDGTGTGSYGGASYSAGPFSLYYDYAQQFLYTAAEIIAAGGSSGNLGSIAFNCTALPALAVPNYKISIKFVPSTLTTLTWQTGMTVVNTTASLLPTATGWVSFPFTNSLPWNGTDNIVVQVCHDAISSTFVSSGNHQYTTKTGRFLYNSYYATSGTSCGTTGSTTSSYLPNVRFGIQTLCQSPRTAVHAYVYPNPIVDLGPDINNCIDAGLSLILNAGVQPNVPQFLWDDNTTSQVRAVNESGTYNVKVTNEYTCSGSDTINVQIRRNPVINLGNDTSVCNGTNLTLDPGNTGIQYFWNTGQTGETIVVNTAGTYNVFVTNSDGCYSADTITVAMQGELPSIQGIQVTNNGQFHFSFNAINAQNVIGYDWDFGDSSVHSYQATPTHDYLHDGSYVVVLRLSSTCGFVNDTVAANIVGIHQINVSNDELSVYPNPTKSLATIVIKGALKMERVQVYNVAGQMIYNKKTDSSSGHVMDLSSFASGMYTIEVFTDKGTVARKLEVIK